MRTLAQQWQQQGWDKMRTLARQWQKQSLEQGSERSARAIAKNMFALGFKFEDIAQATKLEHTVLRSIEKSKHKSPETID